MWHPLTEKPESGRAIVATFNDGSGASLFWVHDHGLMGQDGDEAQALSEKQYELWAYMPEGYRTWIEDNLD